MMLLTKRGVMTQPHIRQARPDEAGDIAALVRASITELCTADHGSDQAKIDKWLENKTEEEVRGWLLRSDRPIFVIDGTDGIKAAGCHDTRGIVLMNYIAPAQRLRDFSSAMLAHLERSMKRQGIAESRLVSTATARGFYEDRGWQAYGDAIPCMGVTGQPMKKWL